MFHSSWPPMKLFKPVNHAAVQQLVNDIADIWQLWCQRKYPTYLLLALCFNLVIASTAFAATGESLSRSQSYALGILAIATLTLSMYLFVVMFQPERF